MDKKERRVDYLEVVESLEETILTLNNWKYALNFVENYQYSIIENCPTPYKEAEKQSAHLFHLFYKDYQKIISNMDELSQHIAKKTTQF